MSMMAQLALACTLVALLPLFVDRRKALFNPALFVFVSVVWGVLAKALYIELWRDRPRPLIHDQVWVASTSPESFERGALLILAALSFYVAGYFAVGRRHFAAAFDGRGIVPTTYVRKAVVALFAVSVVAFVAYLVASGTNPLQGPLSAKRFGASVTEAESRFHYFPYYLFKLGMLSGPLAYAAAFALVRSGEPRDQRFFKVLCALAFIFVLLLSHFASLRLVILMTLLQIILLLAHARARHLVVFASALVLLTAASFAAITFVHRTPPDPDVVQAQMLARAAREAARSGDGGRAMETDAPGEHAATPPGGTGEDADAPPGRTTEDAALADAARAADIASRRSISEVIGHLLSGPLEGRYFLDFTKLAHIAEHFPGQRAHLRGAGVVGAIVARPASAEAAASDALTIDRYLAVHVFEEPRNSIPPGYAGELYIDFGVSGLLAGFLVLGAFHRLIFNRLTTGRSGFIAACAIMLVPNTTIVLLNSGALSALGRSFVEVGVLGLLFLPAFVRSVPSGAADRLRHAHGKANQ